MAEQKNNKQLALREEHIGAVMNRVVTMQKRGELDIPPNYSIGNALNAAWLILQDVQDKDKKPVLEVCTKESIGYTLLRMTIQGLNPTKDQCYFVAYGNKLTLQRSYFGTVAVLKRVDLRVADVVTEIVYKGDKLKYRLYRGKKIITEHEQELANIDDDKIVAAYCAVYDHEGNELASNIMTMAELMQSWKQSRSYPVQDDGKLKPSSTHAKFTGQMAKKTVLNRTCKMLISSSDDSTIMQNPIARTLTESDEEAAASEIAEKANQGGVVDIEVAEAPKQVEPEKKSEPEKPADSASAEVVSDDPGF